MGIIFGVGTWGAIGEWRQHIGKRNEQASQDLGQGVVGPIWSQSKHIQIQGEYLQWFCLAGKSIVVDGAPCGWRSRTTKIGLAARPELRTAHWRSEMGRVKRVEGLWSAAVVER